MTSHTKAGESPKSFYTLATRTRAYDLLTVFRPYFPALQCRVSGVRARSRAQRLVLDVPASVVGPPAHRLFLGLRYIPSQSDTLLVLSSVIIILIRLVIINVPSPGAQATVPPDEEMRWLDSSSWEMATMLQMKMWTVLSRVVSLR